MPDEIKKDVYIDLVDWSENHSEEIKGCFSNNKYFPGDTIIKFNPILVESPSRTSIQIGSSHIEDDTGRYLNHNCNPNASIANEKEPTLVCISEIKPGDEVTIDYNESEEEIFHPFFCYCHDKEIKGKKYKK